MKRATTLSIALIILALGLAGGGCAAPPPVVADVARPVKIIRISGTGTLGRRVFPGTVQGAQQAQLSFRVAGPLVQLPALEGRRVRRGDLLAQIDPRDFETSVRNSEATLANLRAQLEAMKRARPEDIRSLEAQLAAARARLVEARATLVRYERLYENDNVSKAEYDQRRAARDVASAEVARANESLTIALEGARPEDIEAMEARIRAQESELDRARDSLRDSSLRAPYDGTIARVYVDNFEYIQAREPVIDLQDLRIVEVVTQIPEVLVTRSPSDPEGAGPGDLVVVFEGLPGQEFAATVTEVAAQADPITRTFAVTLQARPPANTNIFAGMTAQVYETEADIDTTAFNVPSSALRADESGVYSVWRMSPDSTAEKVVVEVRELAGDSALIAGDLAAGDAIVVAGTHALFEGQKIREIQDELKERR